MSTSTTAAANVVHSEKGAERPERLVSLDAYRGLIMLMMASAGFGFGAVGKHFDSDLWIRLSYQTSHSAWEGSTIWDIIQPAFMFMVGVAIPYSYSRREREGQSQLRMFGHAVGRAMALILLSLIMFSVDSLQTNFFFTTVLPQIALGYIFVVLLRGRGVLLQAVALVAILAGYWLLFYLYASPQPWPGFEVANFKLPERISREDWPLLEGIMAHWNIHTNPAAWFDQWFLNLFPRPEPFVYESGGYQTLNFIPSMATMILGLMAGELLRSVRSAGAKLGLLALVGLVLLTAGLLAGWTICPIVKRIWTPSWVLFSGGIVVWILAAFYAVVDVAGFRRWAFPLVVVGMNSILVYVMACLIRGWTWQMIQVQFGWIIESPRGDWVLQRVFGPAGFPTVYLPIVQSLSVLAVFWLICCWLYRQKIFVRL